MAKNETKISADVDALLDGTVDDLQDKPEFKAFPAGGHLCQIFFMPKAIADVGQGVEIKLVARQTLQLEFEGDEPLNPGDETQVFLFFTHENETVVKFGQGTFKEIMAVLAAKYGAKSNRLLMQEAQGNEMIVLTEQRENKDKTQSFTSILGVQFPE